MSFDPVDLDSTPAVPGYDTDVLVVGSGPASWTVRSDRSWPTIRPAT